MIKHLPLAFVALVAFASHAAAEATNPGIGIAGGITGSEAILLGGTAQYTATLTWPAGVSHPVAGTYTWTASPAGKVLIDGQAGPVTKPVTADSDTVTVKAVSEGEVTLTVAWSASSGQYHMPSTTKRVLAVKVQFFQRSEEVTSIDVVENGNEIVTVKITPAADIRLTPNNGITVSGNGPGEVTVTVQEASGRIEATIGSDPYVGKTLAVAATPVDVDLALVP